MASLFYPSMAAPAKAKAVTPVKLPAALPVIKPNKVTSATPWTDAMKTTGGRWEAPTINPASGYPQSIGSVWTPWGNKQPDRNDLVQTIANPVNPTLTGGGGGHNTGAPGSSVATNTGDHWKNDTSTNDWNSGLTTTNGKVTSNPVPGNPNGNSSVTWKKTGWRDHR